ncbi:MAG TPA: Ig-like domain-containing protein [Steroidobacteraceae bacterium]|nr:Ig-like domain-containing protein [Steroidobacteraceae bacterium]
MNLFKSFGVSLAAALLLAGCGGGNTLSGSSGGGGGGGTSAVAKVTVIASAPTVAADGSTSSTITATALDANNVAVANATVTFAATAGGLLQGNAAKTDSSGHATATLAAIPGTAAGTAITVTVTIGGVAGSTGVNVVAIQQSISVTTDQPQIASDGSQTANIAALLRDANNVALSGVTVTFSATSGVLTVTQATTDATGTAKATLTAGSDPTDRTITVTAAAGSAMPATLPVQVTGTTLSMAGPTNLVLGSQGSYTVSLKNSAGAGISNKTVTLTSANGNTIAPASVMTDGNGQGTFTVTASSAANGGNDTLSAAALGLVATRALAVSSQNFSITTPATSGTKVTLGTAQTITATWLSGGAPQVGQTVTFSATRGSLSAGSAVTDGSGNATVTISSSTAGSSVIAASASGVSAQTTIDFVATNPTQIAVQAAPAAVSVGGSSVITATVRDPANNLVEGATVSFVLQDSTGGSLSVASALTNAQGQAQTTYTAGSTSSSANGVVVTAQVTNASNQTATSSVDLTVGGQTVFLSLGTGNKIQAPDQATYLIQFAVFALDAQGAAVPNIPVTLRILPISYVKGMRVWNGTIWATVPSTAANDPDASPPGTQTCANEDTDYSGIISSLDPPGALPTCTDLVTNTTITQHQKDYNCNNRLDPGNVAAVSPSSGTTDANGELVVNVTYPQDHAYYVNVKLTATATVNGTQSSTSSTFALPGLATDFSQQNTAPPGPTSPYGVANVCSNPL